MIGFGVNYRLDGASSGPEVPGATAVVDELGTPPTLGGLTRALVEGLETELEHLGDAAYAIASFRALSIHRLGDPMRCRAGSGLVEGEFAGFDERGFLRLATAAGETLLSSGEIVEASARFRRGGR